LSNLTQIRKLKAEPSSLREFDGLLRSALERATDARNQDLSLASRFTLGWPPDQWRLLDYCHKKRNLAEYEGHLDVDDALVVGLIAVVDALLAQVPALRSRLTAAP